MSKNLFCSTIELADDHLILGHRLSEWCGHAPTLEEDLSLPNLGLDLLGAATNLYSLASNLEGGKRSEDELAFGRIEKEYKNCLLVEKPNENFGHTMLKQLYFCVFMKLFWNQCSSSKNKILSGISGKSQKEMVYHIRHSGEWVIRLGDGTEESHSKMTEAINELHPYTEELFYMSEASLICAKKNYLPNRLKIKGAWEKEIKDIFKEANLTYPSVEHFQVGGRNGIHTENMGYLISNMQYLQKTYPGQTW